MRLLIPLIIFLTMSFACVSSPEFERDRPDDPGSENFTPRSPRMNTPITIDEFGNVNLTWLDITEFEEYNLVYRSLGKSEPFVLLDTLSASESTGYISYIDSTKEYGFPLRYGVASGHNGNNSPIITREVDMGSCGDLNLTQEDGTGIRISWNKQTAVPTIGLLEFSPDFTNWINIDTVSVNSGSMTFDYAPYTETFDLFFRMSCLFSYNTDKQQIYPDIARTSLSIKYPTNLQLRTIYDDSVLFSWSDNSNFETGFVIKHIHGNSAVPEKIYAPPNTDNIRSYIEPSHEAHIFTIHALDDLKESKGFMISEFIKSDSPSNLRITSINSGEVMLSWDFKDPEDTIARYFRISIKPDSHYGYTPIDTLDITKRSYIIDKLSPQVKYKVRVGTFSNIGYNISIRYVNGEWIK